MPEVTPSDSMSASASANPSPETSEISVHTVQHLADLARIDLTESELALITKDIDLILSNIAKVREVASAEVPATSHPLPIHNVMRADEVADVLTIEEALANAPDSADGMFRVASILGEEQ